MKTRVEVIQETLARAMGYEQSATMSAFAWEVAEDISIALRVHEHELKAVIQHMSNQGTQTSVCGLTQDVRVVKNIDHVDCVECLRRLAKDAGRYGNGRRPRR